MTSAKKGTKTKMYSRRRKRFYKKYKSYRNMAYQAYKGVKFLKGLVNVENHLFDAFLNSQPATSSGTISCLSDIGTGDANNQRQGTSILAKHLTFKASGTMDATAVTTTIRFLIFVDKMNNNVAPVLSDILANTASGISIISPIVEKNTDRFWVLSDQKVQLSVSGDQSFDIERYVKLDFHIDFASTGTGQFERNSIWLLTLSDHAMLTPTINMWSRLSFYDN